MTLRPIAYAALLLFACAALLPLTGCGLGPAQPYDHGARWDDIAALESARPVRSRGTLLVLGALDDAALQPTGVDYALDGRIVHTHCLFGVAPALRDAMHDALRASGARVIKDSQDQGLRDPYPRLRAEGRVRLLRGRLEHLSYERRQGKPTRLRARVALWLVAPGKGDSRWNRSIEVALQDSKDVPVDKGPLLVLGAQVATGLLSDAAFAKELR
jgi:hypothetical protein